MLDLQIILCKTEDTAVALQPPVGVSLKDSGEVNPPSGQIFKKYTWLSTLSELKNGQNTPTLTNGQLLTASQYA